MCGEKQASNSGKMAICRITPACAGKSDFVWDLYSSAKDHPRVCGEKQNSGQYEALKEGSPPRVRGKDIQLKTPSTASGITPACAGKRLIFSD